MMLRLRTVSISVSTLLSCCMFAALCFAQGKPQASPGELIATVAGQPIYEQDLAADLGPKLLQLRHQEYQTKTMALDELIRKKLVADEARERCISSDTLLQQA